VTTQQRIISYFAFQFLYNNLLFVTRIACIYLYQYQIDYVEKYKTIRYLQEVLSYMNLLS
jgi:hypothetical protein